MRKILAIAWKDLRVLFRDPGALLLMLVTPFGLTLAIGAAFGAFTSGNTSILHDIPVVLVNHDTGQIGRALLDVFESEELAELVQPTNMVDDQEARTVVNNDQAAAVVIIPVDFTQSIMPINSFSQKQPLNWDVPRSQSLIEVYTNPTRSISSAIIESIVNQFVLRVNTAAIAGEVSIRQMLEEQIISPSQLLEQVMSIGEQAGKGSMEGESLSLHSQIVTSGEDNQEKGFNWLAYIAPSMAMLFLMFTVTSGGRSILSEREGGTLPRMLATPSSNVQVLGGKIAGIFLCGLVQMTILFVASLVILGVQWGPPLAAAVLVLSLTLAATSWGILVAAFSQTPGQAEVAGTTVTLLFAAVAGNFVPRPSLPGWLQKISYISPNAWGLDGFMALSSGGNLESITLHVLALLAMAAVLFLAALIVFKRRSRI